MFKIIKYRKSTNKIIKFFTVTYMYRSFLFVIIHLKHAVLTLYFYTKMQPFPCMSITLKSEISISIQFIVQ